MIRYSFKSISIPKKDMLLFGFSFFILNSWVSLSQHINSVVISHDLGVEWQGYFDVSLSIAAVITFFSAAIYLISAPETTVKNNRSDILHKSGGLGDIGKLLFSMCLLCVLILYFYSQQIIEMLFTSTYAVAANFIYILAIGYTMLFIQQYVGFLSISSEETRISRLTLITIVSILIFPLFTHLMIVNFGFLGAYLATTVFILIYTLITLFYVKDRTPIKLLFEKGDRLVLAVVGTFLLLFFLNLSLIPGLISASVMFVIMIIAFGYLEKSRLRDMFGIKN